MTMHIVSIVVSTSSKEHCAQTTLRIELPGRILINIGKYLEDFTVYKNKFSYKLNPGQRDCLGRSCLPSISIELAYREELIFAWKGLSMVSHAWPNLGIKTICMSSKMRAIIEELDLAVQVRRAFLSGKQLTNLRIGQRACRNYNFACELLALQKIKTLSLDRMVRNLPLVLDLVTSKIYDNCDNKQNTYLLRPNVDKMILRKDGIKLGASER